MIDLVSITLNFKIAPREAKMRILVQIKYENQLKFYLYYFIVLFATNFIYNLVPTLQRPLSLLLRFLCYHVEVDRRAN